MIFSKSVLLMLTHHERAGAASDFRRKARAQILNNLIVQALAAVPPTFCANQLFHTAAQAAEVNDMRRLAELEPQFVAQLRKKHQLEALAGFEGEMPQVIIDHARR